MKKFKKLLSCAAAATLAVTGIVGGATLGANAAGDLITNGGPYEGNGTYIATYNSADYYHQTAFVLQFKYDVVGEPAAPQPNEPDLGYNDTFEFLVFDQSFGGWNRTTVGPTGYDLGVSYIKPEENVVYTVEVPIEVIESKLSTGQSPFGINIQTGAQLGTSKVTIVSLKYKDTEYVQSPFTVTGNWTKGTASEMTVDPAGAAYVNANADNIIISALDLSNWSNPTVDVTVEYASASAGTSQSDYVQAEIALPTGEKDPETKAEIYVSPDPNYVLHEKGTYTYTTEIPNTTTRFMAAYDQCTVKEIRVYNNTDMNTEIPVSGENATTIKDNMGLAWNLGNALDVVDATDKVNEKAINPKTTKKLIQAVKAAGFNTIKIPVTFLDLMGEDGSINQDYMARIQQVVGYAYDMGMYSIVSLHGDGMQGFKDYWINIDKTGEEFDQIVDKYSALWTNIAQAFTGYDQKVLFQSGNEFMNSEGNYGIPGTQTEFDNINTLNQAFVRAVRNAGGTNNADRALIVIGYNSNIDQTIAGFEKPEDPTADRLILSVNYYDPTDFTLGNVTNWNPNGQYGTSWMDSQFEAITNFANRLGMPVMIGEYGPQFKNGVSLDLITTYNYWVNYYAAYYGIVTAYWDNGETGNGGTALFDRTNNVITPDGQAIVDAITKGYNDGK